MNAVWGFFPDGSVFGAGPRESRHTCTHDESSPSRCPKPPTTALPKGNNDLEGNEKGWTVLHEVDGFEDFPAAGQGVSGFFHVEANVGRNQFRFGFVMELLCGILGFLWLAKGTSMVSASEYCIGSSGGISGRSGSL